MSENIELSYVWDHTIIKILNHDIHSKMGNMIEEWVVFNKLEDINSLLKYTDDDFTPTGKLCYINQNGEKLHRKLIKEFFNLRWYIQHLVDEYEYQYGDNEWTNPLHKSNWTYRTNKQFMKYVNFTLKEIGRIPSTTPGAEPPRITKDSGSARSHSTHLETSSQKRP